MLKCWVKILRELSEFGFKTFRYFVTSNVVSMATWVHKIVDNIVKGPFLLKHENSLKRRGTERNFSNLTILPCDGQSSCKVCSNQKKGHVLMMDAALAFALRL